MMSAGQFLRNERQRLGLSQASISQQTKIPERILDAIEEDRIANIPSAFLYRSFVRQFASVLGVDFGQIADRVTAVANGFPEVRLPGQDFHRIGIPPIRPRRQGLSEWASRVFVLFAVVAACSVLYAYVDGLKTTGLTSIRNLGEGTVTRAKVTLSSLWPGLTEGQELRTRAAKPSADQTALEPSHAAPNSSANEPILLHIAAVEQAWLSIDSDGRHVFSGLLQPEQTKVLEGHDSARIRTGNAGGLQVTFNGRQLGRLGQRGQVRTVLFTNGDQYEILQPNLTSRLQLIPAVAFSRWTR